jgi:hypothetical protein
MFNKGLSGEMIAKSLEENVFKVAVNVANSIYYLYKPRTGQFFCIFVYKTLNQLKTADQMRLRHKDASDLLRSYCCTPVSCDLEGRSNVYTVDIQ